MNFEKRITKNKLTSENEYRKTNNEKQTDFSLLKKKMQIQHGALFLQFSIHEYLRCPSTFSNISSETTGSIEAKSRTASMGRGTEVCSNLLPRNQKAVDLVDLES